MPPRLIGSPPNSPGVEDGSAVLFVDGIDEIPGLELRRRFVGRLTTLAAGATARMLLTSRVVGYRTIGDLVARTFDVATVAPLEPSHKIDFITRFATWAEATDVEATLRDRVLNDHRIARICENVLALSLVTQATMFEVDRTLPDARNVIYRRVVELMLDRQRPGVRDPLSRDEVWPHLEQLAFEMNAEHEQIWAEDRIIGSLRAFRGTPAADRRLLVAQRPPKVWLDDVIDRVQVLTVAGLDPTDEDGHRRMIQFFHLSFQDYFAGRAMTNGAALDTLDAGVPAPAHPTPAESPAATDDLASAATLNFLRERIGTLSLDTVELAVGGWVVAEPMVAADWQETVRHWLETLDSDFTGASPNIALDTALLTLLPEPSDPVDRARARSVFAVQCLSGLTGCRPSTATAILDAAIDHLRTVDGFTLSTPSSMQIALEAIGSSPWSDRCLQLMADRFVSATDLATRRIIASVLAAQTGGVPPGASVPEWIEAQLDAVADGDRHRGLVAVLSLLELFFHIWIAPDPEPAEDGSHAPLPGASGLSAHRSPSARKGAAPQQGVFFFNWFHHRPLVFPPTLSERVVTTLIGIARDPADPVAAPALWALAWFVGARMPGADNTLVASERGSLLAVLTDRSADPIARGQAALLLATRAPDRLPSVQPDAIYHWALVADGAFPQRRLSEVPAPVVTDAVVAAALRRVLTEPGAMAELDTVVVAAARLGLRIPEMVPGLLAAAGSMTDADYRDEALSCLVEIPGDEVDRALHTLSRSTHPDVAERAGLAVIGRGAPDGVLRLLGEGPDGSTDLNTDFESAALLALIGTADPAGWLAFEEQLAHTDSNRRAAAEAALASSRKWQEESD